MNGRLGAYFQMIKYGVTTVDNLCSDLLSWDTLYLSGRMHKPIRIVKDDARVRLTQQVNLVSALRVALLTIPDPQFHESLLFEKIAGFSYAGDPRMLIPAESRDKIANIVRAQGPQFRELYQRLANGLLGVHWATGSSLIEVRFIRSTCVEPMLIDTMPIRRPAARCFSKGSSCSPSETPFKPIQKS
jgi:hypothetical protein